MNDKKIIAETNAKLLTEYTGVRWVAFEVTDKILEYIGPVSYHQFIQLTYSYFNQVETTIYSWIKKHDPDYLITFISHYKSKIGEYVVANETSDFYKDNLHLTVSVIEIKTKIKL